MTSTARVARPWRDYLKPDERARLDLLDAEADQLEQRRSQITFERYRIANRASKRAAAAGAVAQRVTEAAE